MVLSWLAISLLKKSTPFISFQWLLPKIYLTGPEFEKTSVNAIHAVKTPGASQKGQYWISLCQPAFPFVPPPEGFHTPCECQTWIFLELVLFARIWPKVFWVIRACNTLLLRWGLSIFIIFLGLLLNSRIYFRDSLQYHIYNLLHPKKHF